ncbi:MAG: hypothetical protein JWM59_4981 [Verrucomicrobiales bacterium]|nr:hypothetical protein [Verrucomicrobiales bacterium]
MRLLTPLIFLAFGLMPLPVRADFQLRDGDTVAFLGDSITAARGYTKVVEVYTLMRFPDRKVRFINAGQGGDTAFGSLERLDRDVFSKGATVVTVAFGINDIGWGTKANPESRQKYLDGIRTIITRCQERKVRPVICSPTITAEDPDTALKGYLQIMTDDGLALAKSLGADTIDLQRSMREVQRRVIEANSREKDIINHSTLHVKDGVHLSEHRPAGHGLWYPEGIGRARAGVISLLECRDADTVRLRGLQNHGHPAAGERPVLHTAGSGAADESGGAQRAELALHSSAG